jgi:superfamily II DNA helicase RecQ
MNSEKNKGTRTQDSDAIFQSSKDSFHSLVNMCEKPQCRRKVILQFFDETLPPRGCQNCDYCSDPEKVAQSIKKISGSTQGRYL